MQATQVEQVQIGESGPATRRSLPAASSSRAPRAWSIPAPPSVLALPPIPSTTV
jgi:hypothetical protein